MTHPIKQPARSRKFAFAITTRVNVVDALQNCFVLSYATIATQNCAVRSVESVCSTVNQFYTWMEAI